MKCCDNPVLVTCRIRGRKKPLVWDSVPPYEPGDSPDLPHSLYVEAFK